VHQDVLTGGTSGIGTTAIQLAHARGATVLATAGSDEKVAACSSLGASRAINYRTEDFVAAVKTATGGEGVDVVLDIIGGDYLPRNLDCLRLNGRLVQIGLIAGSKSAIDLRPVLQRRLTITGSTLRPRTVAEKGAIARALEREVWPLLERGTVKPIVHGSFPFTRAADAHRELEAGLVIGKLILLP
jgi:NADPH2:quinone reductase